MSIVWLTVKLGNVSARLVKTSNVEYIFRKKVTNTTFFAGNGPSSHPTLPSFLLPESSSTLGALGAIIYMYVAWLYVRCLSAQCPLRGASAHNPYIGGSAGTRHRSKMENRRPLRHPEGSCPWRSRRAFSISFSRRPLADPPWAQQSRPWAASASTVTLEKTTNVEYI